MSDALSLQTRAFAALDARLSRAVDAPLCVAVSGGGDSMALLALACDWRRTRRRRVLALSVDHGLQEGSEAWSALAVETARRLGAEGRVLRWEGDKPATGLTAAARIARHTLLAQAAREAGAGVVLMAHTADDRAEAEVMRAEGSNLGDLRDWGPSPVWPEGRDVFIARPLLGEARATLRAYLTVMGIEWIEDPANNDPKYARTRARAGLAASSPGPHPGNAAGVLRDPASAAGEGGGEGGDAGSRRGLRPSGMRALFGGMREEGGGFAVSRQALRDSAPQTAKRFLSAALVCAAGASRPPRGERLEGLLGRLMETDEVSATLAGAQVRAFDDEILIGRETPRGGLQPLPIQPGAVSVWDGRYALSVKDEGYRVVAAAGLMAQLSHADRKEILGLSPILRGSQPLLVGPAKDGGEARPVLAARVARVRCLTGSRLGAACGQIAHEREIA